MKFFLSFLLPQLVVSVAIIVRDQSNRAAYFLDNDPSGSSIIAMKIDSTDGKLSDPVRISTGWKGLFGLAGSPPVAGNAVPLHRQCRKQHNRHVPHRKSDPTHPKILPTAPTLGDFPSAVAYSTDIKTACVINGGAIAGVLCFSVTHDGLKPLGGLRPLALSKTTPPVGPPFTASDIVFNPSSTALFVTTKGSPTSPGKIYAFTILRSGVTAAIPIVFSPSGLLLDFSMSFTDDSKAIISDPAYGASLISISPTLSVDVANKIAIPNQGAICWSQFSPRFNTIFLFDAGHPNITLVDPSTGAIKGVVTQAGSGSLDAMLDRSYLYVSRGASVVSVIDNAGLNAGKMPIMVQELDLRALGSRRGWTGMSVYPSS